MLRDLRDRKWEKSDKVRWIRSGGICAEILQFYSHPRVLTKNMLIVVKELLSLDHRVAAAAAGQDSNKKSDGGNNEI